MLRSRSMASTASDQSVRAPTRRRRRCRDNVMRNSSDEIVHQSHHCGERPGRRIVMSVERGERRLITLALFVATFLVSLNASVVSTAMPTVIGQIGGIELYAWVFSAY